MIYTLFGKVHDANKKRNQSLLLQPVILQMTACMNLDVAKKRMNSLSFLYDLGTNKHNSVLKIDLKVDMVRETEFVDSKISPLLIDLHLVLVGNSPTKFKTFGTEDIAGRSNEEEALGKHLNNILTFATSTSSAMISHTFWGSKSLWSDLVHDSELADEHACTINNISCHYTLGQPSS